MTKKKTDHPQTEVLMAFPAGTLSKLTIEGQVERWLNDRLLIDEAAPIYVQLKQMEYAVKTAIEKLQSQAFDDAGMKLGGTSSGTILGQKVEISYPKRWEYSPAILELQQEQKTALEIAQKREQLDGLAHQFPGKGVIRITIKAQ